MEMEKHGRTLCVLELYSKDSAVGAGVPVKDGRTEPAQGTHSRGEGKQHHRKRGQQQPRRACSRHSNGWGHLYSTEEAHAKGGATGTGMQIVLTRRKEQLEEGEG